MSAPVLEVRLTERTVDEQTGVEHREYFGTVWRVHCDRHNFDHDCDSERQAQTLSRRTESFCQGCADEIRESIVLDSEHAKELRDEQRAHERESEYDRTGRT